MRKSSNMVLVANALLVLLLLGLVVPTVSDDKRVDEVKGSLARHEREVLLNEFMESGIKNIGSLHYRRAIQELEMALSLAGDSNDDRSKKVQQFIDQAIKLQKEGGS